MDTKCQHNYIRAITDILNVKSNNLNDYQFALKQHKVTRNIFKLVVRRRMFKVQNYGHSTIAILNGKQNGRRKKIHEKE